MPVYAHDLKDTIAGFNAASNEPRGQRSSRLRFGNVKGVPRVADLITIRALEQTHTVSLPIDTIQQQVSSTPFSIVPDMPPNDSPTDAHDEAAAELENWFEGGYNPNPDDFDTWIKQITNGILSVNAGVTELVPDNSGYLSEMYVRDGATFTRNPDDHGRLPDPPEPAYWQFSLHGAMEPFSRDRALRDLADEIGPLGYGRRSREPVQFSRDEIVWMDEDGKEWHEYGFGRVQKVARLVEIILNQDLSNKKYFPANEVPEGIVNVVEANQDQVDEIREWWDEEIKGERHKVGILGGNGSDIEWMPFRASPEELEFIESQKWYNKLVWMVFGLNQNEVGDISEITRPGGTEQFAATIWRRTTKPLLELIANAINSQILPYFREYEAVDGEIKFEWTYDNPQIRKLERQRQHEDLQNGLATVNEVRRSRGEDELPWGDLPSELRKSAFRNFPKWALEQFGDFDELPSGSAGGGGPLGLAAGAADVYNDAGGESLPTPSNEDGVIPLAGVGKDEALRNEYWSGDFPPLAGHVEDLEKDLATPFLELADDLEEEVAEEFPEEGEEERVYGADGEEVKGILPDVADIANSISLAPRLRDIVTGANVDAMGESAEWHAGNLEDEIEENVDSDEEIEVEISFEVEDTLAREYMERETARNMVSVEDHVKDRIRSTLLDVAEDGGNVNDATEAVREVAENLSDVHSRTVARTETLSASRFGSQAMAEDNDVIAGKEWNASSDSRVRSWHEEMDGVIVPKDEEFVVPTVSTRDDEYQPPDYPRSTLVVGGDQPFNCRCSQDPVLDEEMPEDVEALAAEYDDVLVYEATPRRREVAEEHRQPGETLVETIERVIAEESGSVTAAAERLGLSKPTVYDWRDGGLSVA